MAASITHAKVVNTTQVPDPTQAQLNTAIALGQYPVGTVLADIALGSDHNDPHTFSGLVQSPASSVAGQVPMFGATSDILATASFLAGFDTTVSINDTVPVASFTAYDTGYANIDAVIAPKGQGSFMLQVPDGTTAGGNKRGIYSVDLQLIRSDATQVASGSYCFLFGRASTNASIGGILFAGSSTLSSAANNAFGAGFGLNITNAKAVGIGTLVTLSGVSSIGIGVQLNVSGNAAATLGYQNTMVGGYSFSMGYRCETTSAGTYTFLAGVYLKSSATGAMVFGKGVSSANRLHNTVANSIWFAARSTVPSLAIWNAGGTGLYGKVSIGSATAPTDDCLFEVVSTTKGSRPLPKMTTAEKTSIATPSEAMLVHDTDQKVPNVYITAWEQIALDTKFRNQFLLMGA